MHDNDEQLWSGFWSNAREGEWLHAARSLSALTPLLQRARPELQRAMEGYVATRGRGRSERYALPEAVPEDVRACIDALTKKQSGEVYWLSGLASVMVRPAEAELILRAITADGTNLSLGFDGGLVFAQLLVALSADRARLEPFIYWLEAASIADSTASLLLPAFERICVERCEPGLWARGIDLAAQLGHTTLPAWIPHIFDHMSGDDFFWLASQPPDLLGAWLPLAMSGLDATRAERLLEALWADAPKENEDELADAAVALLERLDKRAAWASYLRLEPRFFALGRRYLTWPLAHAPSVAATHALIERYVAASADAEGALLEAMGALRQQAEELR